MSAILAYVSPTTQQFSVLEFDVITGESHEIGATVSEHPVEEGANIADHVRPDLQRLKIKAYVTDTPINQVTQLGIGPGTLQGQATSTEVPGRTSRQLTQFSIEGGYAPLTLPGNVPLVGNISVPTNGFKRPFVPATVHPSEWGYGSNSVNGYFLKFDTKLRRCWGIFNQLEYLCSQGVIIEVSTDLRYYERMLITSVTAPREATSGIEFSIDLQQLRTAKTQKTFVKRRAKPVEKRAAAQVDQGKKTAPQTVPDSTTVARILGGQLSKVFGGLFQ